LPGINGRVTFDPEHGGAASVSMAPHDRLSVEGTISHQWATPLTSAGAGATPGTTVGIGCTISMI
jgi:hypothetical protein